MKKYFFIYLFVILLQTSLYTSQESKEKIYINGTHCIILYFNGLSANVDPEAVCIYARHYLPLTISGGYPNQEKKVYASFDSPPFFATDFGQLECQNHSESQFQKYLQDSSEDSYFVYAVSQGAATYINSGTGKYKKAPRAIILESPLYFPNSAISHSAGIKKLGDKLSKKILPHFAPLIFANYKPSGQQPIDSTFFRDYQDPAIPIIIVVHEKDPTIPPENSFALYYAACKERENQENKNVYLIKTAENNPENDSHSGLFQNETSDGFKIRAIIHVILRKHDIVYHQKKNSSSGQYEDFISFNNQKLYKEIMQKISSNDLKPDHQNYKKYYDHYWSWHKFDQKYERLFNGIRKAIKISIISCCLYVLQKGAGLFSQSIRSKPFFMVSIFKSLANYIK